MDDGATGTGGNYATSSIKIVISRVHSNLYSLSSHVFEGGPLLRCEQKHISNCANFEKMNWNMEIFKTNWDCVTHLYGLTDKVHFF